MVLVACLLLLKMKSCLGLAPSLGVGFADYGVAPVLICEIGHLFAEFLVSGYSHSVLP